MEAGGTTDATVSKQAVNVVAIVDRLVRDHPTDVGAEVLPAGSA